MNSCEKEGDNVFVIGDVHGCFYTLQNLIRQFPKDAKLIFVGDLCDKGDHSSAVIDFVIENKHRCVKGNHEHLFEKYMLDACEHDIHSPWSSDRRFGGLQTIQSYRGDRERIRSHLAWISRLPAYIQIGKYFITHGFALEYFQQRDNAEYYNHFLLNRIYEDTVEPYVAEDIVNVFGHCPFDEVQRGEKYLCLDTGCAKGGKLSAFSLADQNIYEENLDPRDSGYCVKELTLDDIETEHLDPDTIDRITLKKGCRYAAYDVVSNDVLHFILQRYPEEAKALILAMQERAVIFPKQARRVLSDLADAV